MIANQDGFVLKGNILYSKSLQEIASIPSGFLVCVGGRVEGVFATLPSQYSNLPLQDYGDKIIIPGLVDLHVHAPQFTFRGLGMDMELLEWLETHTFPEESKYSSTEYAQKAYSIFVDDLQASATTRACIFGTIHTPSTIVLMDLLEQSGLVTMVGKVNMDRNSPDYLCETSAAQSLMDTRQWLETCNERYSHTMPILTPRFIPSCTDNLMMGLSQIQKETGLPVQSHLSENLSEINWVKELCPTSKSYSDAYNQFGLFGGENCPTIMAHCVHLKDEEIQLIKKNNVYVAHCANSNANLLSGIAPVRQYLNNSIPTGLGSDIAGGVSSSIFRAMADAIQASKLRWRLVDESLPALTMAEAFYLGTRGGGSFFGKVGSFEQGYEFDAVVLDDTNLPTPLELTPLERLERLVYLSDERNVVGKFARGNQVK